MKYIVYLL